MPNTKYSRFLDKMKIREGKPLTKSLCKMSDVKLEFDTTFNND